MISSNIKKTAKSLPLYAEMDIDVKNLTFPDNAKIDRYFSLEIPNQDKKVKNAKTSKKMLADISKLSIGCGAETQIKKTFGEDTIGKGQDVNLKIVESYERFKNKQSTITLGKADKSKQKADRGWDVVYENGCGGLRYLPFQLSLLLQKKGYLNSEFINKILDTEWAQVKRTCNQVTKTSESINEGDTEANKLKSQWVGSGKTLRDLGAEVSIEILQSGASYIANVKLILPNKTEVDGIKYKSLEVDLISFEVTGEALQQLKTPEGLQDIIDLASPDTSSKAEDNSRTVKEATIIKGLHQEKIVPAMEHAWNTAKNEYLYQFKEIGTSFKVHEKMFMAVNQMLPEPFQFDEDSKSFTFGSGLVLVFFTFVLPIIPLNFIWKVLPFKLLFSAISYAYLSLLAHHTFSDWDAEQSKTDKFKLLLISLLKGAGLTILWPLSQLGQIISKIVGSPIPTRNFAIKEGLDTEAGSKGVLKNIANRYKIGQILGAIAVGITLLLTVGSVILSALIAMSPVGWVLMLSLLVLLGQAIYRTLVKPSGESPAVTTNGNSIDTDEFEMLLSPKNRTLMYLFNKIRLDTARQGADKEIIFRKFVENLALNNTKEVEQLYLELADLHKRLLLEIKNGGNKLGIKLFGDDYNINKELYLAHNAKIMRFFQLCHNKSSSAILKAESVADQQLIADMKLVVFNSYLVFEQQRRSGTLVAHYLISDVSKEIFDVNRKFPSREGSFTSPKDRQRSLAINNKLSDILRYTKNMFSENHNTGILEILTTPRIKSSEDEYTDVLTEFKVNEQPKVGNNNRSREVSLIMEENDDESSVSDSYIAPAEASRTTKIEKEMQQSFNHVLNKMLGLEELTTRDFDYFDGLTKMAENGNELATKQLSLLKQSYIVSLGSYSKFIALPDRATFVNSKLQTRFQQKVEGYKEICEKVYNLDKQIREQKELIAENQVELEKLSKNKALQEEINNKNNEIQEYQNLLEKLEVEVTTNLTNIKWRDLMLPQKRIRI